MVYIRLGKCCQFIYQSNETKQNVIKKFNQGQEIKIYIL
jgi:hypothetical protein